MSPHAKVIQQDTFQPSPRQRITMRPVPRRRRDESARWAERIANEIEHIERTISPDIEVELDVLGAPRTDEILLLEAVSAHLFEAGDEPTYPADAIIKTRAESGGTYRPVNPEFDHHLAAVDGTLRLMREWYDSPLPTTADAWIESLQTGHRTMFPHELHRSILRPGSYRGEYNGGSNMLDGIDIPPPHAIEDTLVAGFCAAQASAPTDWRRHAMLEFVVLRVAPFRGGNERMARAMGIRNLPRLRPFDTPYLSEYWRGARQIMEGYLPEFWLHCLTEAHRRATDIQSSDTAEQVLARWGDRGWSASGLHTSRYRCEWDRTREITKARGIWVSVTHRDNPR